MSWIVESVCIDLFTAYLFQQWKLNVILDLVIPSLRSCTSQLNFSLAVIIDSRVIDLKCSILAYVKFANFTGSDRPHRRVGFVKMFRKRLTSSMRPYNIITL